MIGVAADVKYLRINEAPRPYFYLPFLQSLPVEHDPVTRGARRRSTSSSTRRARAIAALDPDLPIVHAGRWPSRPAAR